MQDHQNLISMLALVSWPIASILIFAASKSFAEALIWNVLVGQLILPVGAEIKFQMIPPINKTTVVNLCCLAGYLLFRGRRSSRTARVGWVEVLLVLAVVTPIATSELNSDAIFVGQRYLPGVGLYDALSAVETTLIALIPFLLGRTCLQTEAAQFQILRTLTVVGLIYSLPMLFEIRFSPQLHYWVYGYYPTEFVQAIRDGGFRPMVFMGHGLLAAFFMMTCTIAATALVRMKVGQSANYTRFASPYLGVVLILCKSLGALIYGIAGAILVRFFSPKTQLRVAVCLVTVSLSYPLLRSLDLVPTSAAVDLATLVSKERAQSLAFRLDNEDALLGRAFQRPFFGWGRYGRSRVYDPDTGKDLSVTDGRWIIDIGQFGLIGFLVEFGLLATCVYRAASAGIKLQSGTDAIAFSALALILSINMVDLIPNSSLIPMTWLIAGSVLGRAEQLHGDRTAHVRRRSPAANAPAL